MQKAAASVHPTKRGPTADAGCGHGDREDERQDAAVAAVAAWGATIPAKSTAKPDETPWRPPRRPSWVDTTVPSAMKQLPTT